MKKTKLFLLTLALLLTGFSGFSQTNGIGADCKISLPYSEDFEDVSSVNCWTLIQLTTSSGQFPAVVSGTTTNPCYYTGGLGLKFTGKGTEYAVMPLLEDGANIQNVRLMFWGRQKSAGTCEIGLMTNPNDESTFTLVTTVTNAAQSSWEYFTVTFSNFTNANGKYIAFRRTSTSTLSTYYWAIDDLLLEEVPSCEAIDASSVTVSGITENSASVSFTDPHSSNNAWKIYYKVKGSEEDYSSVSVTSKTAEISGLDAATDYEVYVVADCGTQGESAPSNLAYFTTKTINNSVNGELILDLSDLTALEGHYYTKSNSANKWVIGDAADGASDAILISNDEGVTNYYTDVTTNAYFTIPLTFDNKTAQVISFDYKVGGPEDVNVASFSAFIIDENEALPSAGIPSTATVILNKTTQIDDWTNVAFSTEGFASTTKQLVFYWEIANANPVYHQDPAAAVKDIVIRTSDCQMPNNLALVSSDQTSVTVKWDQGGTVESWTVYYKEENEPESSWSSVTVNGTSASEYTISGLEQDSYYYVYVTAVCDGNDAGSTNRLYVHTACGTVTELPWSDNFDKMNGFACWTVVSSDNNSPSVQSSDNAYSGTNYMQLTNNSGLIVTPAFEDNVANLRLELFARTSSVSNEAIVEIGVMDDLTDLTSFSPLDTLENPGHTNWFRYVVDFENTQSAGSDKYIAIRYTSEVASNAWYIDDVTVDLSPSCKSPEFNSLAVSNPTSTSVDVTFTDNDPTHGNWKFYYKNVNSEQWTSQDITSKSLTIDNLSAETKYEAYVATVCDGTDDEDSTQHVFFATSCGIINVSGFPYRNDFSDTADAIGPACWTVIEGPSGSEGVGYGEEIYPSYGYNTAMLDFKKASLLFFRGDCGIATPQLGVDIRNVQLKFDYYLLVAADPSYKDKSKLKIGVLADTNNLDTWEEIAVLTDAETDKIKTAVITFENVIDYIGSNRYIALRYEAPVITSSGHKSVYIGWYIDNVEISFIDGCSAPLANSVNVTEITSSSAKVSFTDNNSDHNAWAVHYQAEGSDEVFTEQTYENEVTITDLDPATVYNVWVRTQCEPEVESQDSTIAYSFSTKGVTVSTNVAINFEDINSSNYFARTAIGPNKWVIGSATGNQVDGESTVNSLYVSNDGYSYAATAAPAEAEKYYTYAALTVEFGNSPEYTLSFDYKVAGSYNRGLLYAYLLDADAVIPKGGLPDTTNGITLLSSVYNKANWIKFKKELNGVENTTKQLLFVWYNTYASGTNDPAAIDNISIKATDCAAPVVRVVAIEDTSATFAWEKFGGESWTVSYTKAEPQNWQVITTQDTFVTIGNLEKATSYRIYVTADCGEEGISKPSTSIDFTTETYMPVAGKDGYIHDFEDPVKNQAFSFQSYNYDTAGHNAWTIGSAPYEYMDSTGNALYVSENASDYHYYYYTTSHLYATLPIKFSNFDEYQIRFDYMLPGGNYTAAKLEVYLVNSDYELPRYGSLDGELLLTKIVNGATWTTFYSAPIENVKNETRKLVFYWYNYGTSLGTENNFNPPIALDNIQIMGSNCPQNTNLAVSDITDETVKLTWKSKPNIDTWKIDYTILKSNTQQEVTVSSDDVTIDEEGNVSYVLYNLLAGHKYTARVSSKCSDGEFSNPSQQIQFSVLGKTVKNFPYFQSFEDETLNNTFAYSGTGSNQWNIGTAAGVPDMEGSDGIHSSLYISNDGGQTNNYVSTSTSYAYTYMNIEFGEKPEYNIEFDYYSGGRESADNFNAYLVPIDYEIPETGYLSGGTELIKYSYGVNSWKHVSFKLDTVTGKSYKLVFYWKNFGIINNPPAPAIDNIKITGSDCPSVSNLKVEGRKQTTTMDLTWDYNSSTVPDYWTVYYRPRSSYGVDYDYVTTSTTSVTLENLDPGVNYSIKVTANCSDENESVITYLEESTMCEPVEGSWSDGFDYSDYIENRSAPLCWIRLLAAPDMDPLTKRTIYFPSVVTYGNEGLDGDATALEFRSGNGTLATKTFASKIENMSLEFYAKQNDTTGVMTIYVASDAYDQSTWEPVYHLDSTMLTSTYKKFEISLQNVVNRGEGKCLVFEYIDTNYDGGSWYFDNFRMLYNDDSDIIPTCDNPVEIIVKNSTVTDGIPVVTDENSAAIEWTTTGEETRWDYKLELTGDWTTTSTKTATFNDLVPGTVYTAYVRIHCVTVDDDGKVTETGETSAWQEIVFKTGGLTPGECPVVTDLNVVETTETSVKVSWTGNSSAPSQWEVAIAQDESSNELTPSMIQTVTSSEAEFTNLTDGTLYKVFVRTVCQYNTSDWDSVYVSTVEAWKAPVVTTKDASNKTYSSAVLNGNVVFNSETITEVGFEVRRSNEDTTHSIPYALSEVASSFTFDLIGLESSTSYRYRAYVLSSGGTKYYGGWVEFTTLEFTAEKPIVTTYSVDDADIDTSSVVLSGRAVKTDEDILTRGFIYRPLSGAENTVVVDVTTDVFTATVTDLQPGTQYLYYAFATTNTYKGATMVKGDEMTFTTKDGAEIPAQVTTLDPVAVEHNTATLKGNIVPGNREIETRGFKYFVKGTTDTVTVSATGNNMTAVINNLQPLTEYTYFAFATTAENLYTGENKDFTTAAEPAVNPQVTTLDAENITYNSATLRGSVSGGNVTVTEYGFVYRVANSADSIILTATVNGKNMTASASGLTENTSYTYYAFVKTETETLVGDEKSFNTSAAPQVVDPTVVTGDATVEDLTATLNATVTKGTENITASGFRYRISGESAWTNEVAATITSDGKMSVKVENLANETTYEYLAFAVTESGKEFSGETKTFTIHKDGLTDTENGVSVSLYPNPTVENATLNVKGLNTDAQITLTDVNGRVISSQVLAKGQTTVKINTENMAAGVYYIKIISGDTARTQKLIKK